MLPSRYVRRSVSVANWSQVGAMIGVTGCFLAAFAGGLHGTISAFLGPTVLVGTLSGWVGSFLGRARKEERHARQVRHRSSRASLTGVREAGEGDVRIEGVVRPRRLVQSPGAHTPCVAFSVLVLEGESLPMVFHEVSAGGAFTLEDDAGEVAEVDASYVVFVESDHGLDRELVVREGDRIEVVGHARRVPDASGSAVEHHRSMHTRLMVEGTQARPLLVRAR